MKKLLMTLTLLVSIALLNCREQKSAEDKVEDAMENVEDAAEDVGDEIEDGAEDMGDEMEDAVDDN